MTTKVKKYRDYTLTIIKINGVTIYTIKQP